MRSHLSLLVTVVMCVAVLAIGEVNSAATVVTTNQDGSINCDGLKCPPGNGVRCEVNSNTLNGKSTVERKCIDATGAVLAQGSYHADSPGLSFAKHSSMAILYTKNLKN